LKRNGEHATIWYPDNNNRKLKIPKGNSIYLACPGKDNNVTSREIAITNTEIGPEDWGNEVEAVCVKNKIFNVKGVPKHFSSLVCKSDTWHDANYMDANYTNSLPCFDGDTIEIGFNVNDIFIPTIELCHNKMTHTTYYTKFNMTKMIGSSQTHYPR